MTLAKQRLLYITVMLALAGASWLVYAAFFATLRDTRFITGWALLALVLILTLLNARKKLPFVPLGDASSWLRFHVYAGSFALALFLIHVEFRLPSGYLETLLALLFLGVLLSGFAGLLFSRMIPPRLTTHSDNVLFERIPALRQELAWEVKRLVLLSVEEANSKLIPDFYAARLLVFFERPRHFLFHLSESDRPKQKLLAEVAGLNRYASPKEKEILEEIAERVSAKNDLDYQYALQWMLKGWLFVHIPLTYSLLLVSLLHLLVGYDFRGDLP